MTSDRLLLPVRQGIAEMALLISMALRHIPLFAVQAKRVRDTQKVLGLYKEDNIADDIRGGARVFNVMVGWALENGIITADSMAARLRIAGAHHLRYTSSRARMRCSCW